MLIHHKMPWTHSLRILPVAGLFLLVAPGLVSAGMLPSSTALVDQYLITGMRKSGIGDAVNIQNTEIGADRSFLSNGSAGPNTTGEGGPNTFDVFAERWGLSQNPQTGDTSNVPPGAASVFEGVDWSGNVAITSQTGQFSMSNVDVFADIGINVNRTPVSGSKQSVSNTYFFPDQDLVSSGLVDNNVGISSFNSAPLLSELSTLKSDIQGFTSEFTITSNIENQNAKDASGPFVTDLDAADTNGDGLAIIDIDRGGSDFELNNSDWILKTEKNTLAVFRVLGESNFNLSNSSILMGDGGIVPAPVQQDIGAIFFKGDSEGSDSSDKVFNFNNVILNGIGIWDLVTVGDMGTTEIGINDGQGCAQFVGSSIDFNDVRWNRCRFATLDEGPEPVPEPSSFAIFAIGALCMGGMVRRRKKLAA